MKIGNAKYCNIGLSVLVGIGMFLFWYVAYPHALSYQEQYQLFLWTGDYFLERVSVPGGFADWVGEFIVQFYYVGWLGALLLALLFVALQRLTARLLPKSWLLLSLVPVALLWWLMGDINVLLSLPVAVVLALALACVRVRRSCSWADVLILPVAYWLIGPVVSVSCHPRGAVRVETPVDSGLADGCAADGLCLATAPVAAADGNDGVDLLSYPIALPAVEWVRQGYV